MNLISTSSIRNYWERLPDSLRLIIKARLWTAIGAGGVLYLSPIIFNSIGFSAEQIGSGITTVAFTGIISRFGTGYFLDKTYSYIKSIKFACLFTFISNYILFYSESYLFYLSGQFFLGAAAGIYWPSVELAIPINCNDQIKSNEGYSIARSADAIGVALGVLIGTIGTRFELPRIIYFIDIICMISIFYILLNKLEEPQAIAKLKTKVNLKKKYRESTRFSNLKWLLDLVPLLLLTLFVTGVMTLIQSILPLDLANGGVIRPPLADKSVATLLTFKLILIAIFQWPIGYIIRHKNSYYKFRLCLLSLLTGFIFLSISNFLINGYILILLSFIAITIALCIFLPSASDAIIKSSPIKYHGSAIALSSQCFGISSLTIPWMAGKLIDNNNTAFKLWVIVSLICLLLIPISKRIK